MEIKKVIFKVDDMLLGRCAHLIISAIFVMDSVLG